MLTKKRFFELTQKFSTLKPVLVVGDVGIDKYSSGVVSRISPEAPVPVLEVQKEWLKLGLAANVTDNLKSLGVNSTLCSVIGDDKNASSLEELLEEGEQKIWGLVRDGSRMTTFKERVVAEVQQICRIDYETKEPIQGQSLDRLVERIDEFSQDHSAIIIEDYGKGVLTQELCQKVIQIGRDKKISIAVDPSRSTPPEWYRGATLLKPNLLEAQLMASSLGYVYEKDPEKIASILLDKLSLEQVIITLGAKGMGILDKMNKFRTIPTVAREVFDVSGAGDTAISTIVASLSAGATLDEASWLGNCASGVVVEKKGTALVSLKELETIFDESFVDS